MGKYDETVCHCALNNIFGFEPRLALALVDSLGSASAVFEMDRDRKDEIFGPYSKYRDKVTEESLERAADELNSLAREGGRFLSFCDADFPPLLKECEDPPLGLYYKSCSPPGEIFRSADNIAIVGTRDISPYGREWCERIVGAIGTSGSRPTIVSGLAIGTDITAHIAALESGLPTIGVMATGVDEVYPYRHRKEAERIASTPGCALLTDYPPKTKPITVNFLRRNRIIAGMSRSTILVESKMKGGGMMTAGLAFSYGRDVYALPGRVDDIRSQGCNKLIREKIAEPITDELDLVRSLGLRAVRKVSRDNVGEIVENMYGNILTGDEKKNLAKLLLTIRKNRGATLDELSRLTGLHIKDVSDMAILLEGDGIIEVDLLQRCTFIMK